MPKLITYDTGLERSYVQDYHLVTKLPPKILISTVFTGVDFYDDGNLWETIIFMGREPMDKFMSKSFEGAKYTHYKVVRAVVYCYLPFQFWEKLLLFLEDQLFYEYV